MKNASMVITVVIVLFALTSCRKNNVEATKINEQNTSINPPVPKLQKISGTSYPDAWYKGRRYYYPIQQDCYPTSRGNCLEDVIITARRYQLFVDGVSDAIVNNTVPSFFSKTENYKDIIPHDPFGNEVISMLSSGYGSIKLIRNSDTKTILLGSDATEVEETNAAFAIPIIAQ